MLTPPMLTSRRRFMQASAVAAVSAGAVARAADVPTVTKEALDRILDQPVLKTDFVKSPVTVASIELLRNGKTYLLRTRSTDGAEAITVPNSDRLANVYPLLLNQIIPVVIKKDARMIESLLWDIYR